MSEKFSSRLGYIERPSNAITHDDWSQYLALRKEYRDDAVSKTARTVSVHANRQLYTAYEHLADIPPNVAIFIPVVAYENFTNVENVVARINARAKEEGLVADVFLCCNIKTSFPGQDPELQILDFLEEASTQYQAMEYMVSFAMEQTRDKSGRIRLQLMDKYPGSDTNFNQLRSWYTEEYIYNKAIPDNMPLDTVMVWLDADTPLIGHGTLSKLIETARAGTAHLAKANTRYASSGYSSIHEPYYDEESKTDTYTPKPPFTKRSYAEKSAALYGTLDRQIKRNLGPFDDRGYVDESGLAMTLKKIIEIGGVPTTDPEIGESRGMLRRIAERLDSSIPAVQVIPESIVYDYRRAEAVAETSRPVMIPMSEEGEGYQTYTDLTTVDLEPIPVTLEGIKEMFVYMVKRQKDRTGEKVLTERQIRRFAATVLRFFPEFNTYQASGDAAKGIEELAIELEYLAR